MDYYRLQFDGTNFPNMWYLTEPLTAEGQVLDARKFTYGRRYDGLSPAIVPIKYEGDHLAFNMGAFDMPVVTPEVADIILRFANDDVELFPVRIGDANGEEAFIVNVIRTESCVSEEVSRPRFWGPDDGRPDKIGQYHCFDGPLTLNPERANGAHIFRIKGSIVELIVSKDLKAALECVPMLGLQFKKVT